MIPEIGHLALWLALFCALGQALVPALGVIRHQGVLMLSAPAFFFGQFAFVLLAFMTLVWAFLSDDFSVAYVANNSNSLLPFYYKLAAVWGAHEGSLVLWILIMCLWTLTLVMDRRLEFCDFKAAMLAAMGGLSFGFLLFLLTTSNPFSRLLPFPPIEGADLNPQLQDFGLIVHPPMLYVGYVGFSVVFVFAVAALWRGRLNMALVRWIRPWVNAAWAFLGVGIVLGSWWAYYELGWGGWWFWDAVENASFMPWLMATALVHSLAVTEKRSIFKSWTLLLALLTFSFSLLGAFLVRSGVLTSVHSFAVDPERGLFILIFFVVVTGGSLVLYAFRASQLVTAGSHELCSKETSLLANNLLLVVATGTILLGTLFPLAYEVFSGGRKLSVGAPYFNTVFLPLLAVLAFILALGPLLRWKHMPISELGKQVSRPAAISIILGLALSFMLQGELQWPLVLVGTLSAWILSSLLIALASRWRQGRKFIRPTPSWWGMWLAHLGFVICMIGIVLTSQLSESEEILLVPGEEVVVGDYRFHFQGVSQSKGPNYLSDAGVLIVQPLSSWFGSKSVRMLPEKRYYPVRSMAMTEAAIEAGFWRDLYVALGTPAATGNGWSIRIQFKPFVRWIWLGGALMSMGGLICLFDKRYRNSRLPANVIALRGNQA